MNADKFLQAMRLAVIQRKQEKERYEALNGPKEAFIYAVNSQSFPDLIKIGKADNISKRLVSLNTSMPVHPYTLVVSFGSFDSMKSEREAHRHFNEQRAGKEFFKISVSQAKLYFTQKQREHLQCKFDLKVQIRLNVLKNKIFKAWASVHNPSPVKRLSTCHDVIPVKRCKTQSQSIWTLNADIWTNVAMHLRPRHLTKLMTVSKAMMRAVDSPSYWLREAVVVSWKVGPLGDGCQVDLESLVGPSRMANVGYNEAMNDFIVDIRGFIKHYHQEYSMNITSLDAVDKLSLSQLFELGKSVECDHIESADISLAPKAFCNRHKCTHPPGSAGAIEDRLVQRIDDIPIERSLKQQIVREILNYLQHHPDSAAQFATTGSGDVQILSSVSSPFYIF